jgi:hypothetical protein
MTIKSKLFAKKDPAASRRLRIKRLETVLTPENLAPDPAYLGVEALKAMDAPGWEQAVNCELLYMEDELDDEDAKLV